MGCWDHFLIKVGVKRARGPRFITTCMMLLAFLLLSLISGVVNLGFKPVTRFFTEGDPTLSYPYIKDADATIPSAVVVLLSSALPLLVVIFFHGVLFQRDGLPVGRKVHKRALISILWLLMSFMLAVSVTSVIKFYEGRLRPDFFAMCNYKGYRTALERCGDVDPSAWNACINTHLQSPIVPGAPGDLKYCLDQDHIKEGQSSYPSGHSSVSMAGLGWLSFFIYYSLDGRHWISSILRVVTPGCCMFGAIMIAATRPRDYWHNFSDINFGMSIGFLCMVVCGRMWQQQMVSDEVLEGEDEMVASMQGQSEGDARSSQRLSQAEVDLEAQQGSGSSAAVQPVP